MCHQLRPSASDLLHFLTRTHCSTGLKRHAYVMHGGEVRHEWTPVGITVTPAIRRASRVPVSTRNRHCPTELERAMLDL